MPGFRGGLFAFRVLYLFRLRLPFPYLSIGDLSERRSSPPSFFARALRACRFRVLSFPLVCCTVLRFFVFFPCVFSPGPVLRQCCQTVHNPLSSLSQVPISSLLSFLRTLVRVLSHHLLPLASLTLPFSRSMVKVPFLLLCSPLSSLPTPSFVRPSSGVPYFCTHSFSMPAVLSLLLYIALSCPPLFSAGAVWSVMRLALFSCG